MSSNACKESVLNLISTLLDVKTEVLDFRLKLQACACIRFTDDLAYVSRCWDDFICAADDTFEMPDKIDSIDINDISRLDWCYLTNTAIKSIYSLIITIYTLKAAVEKNK